MLALPSLDEEDQIVIRLEVVWQHKVFSRNGQLVPQILVRWLNLELTDATWEDEAFIEAQFPDFHFSKTGKQPQILEDKDHY